MKLKKSFSILITFLAILITPALSSAQDSSNKKIANVTKGQEAPFDGVLLSPQAFAELHVEDSIRQSEIEMQAEFLANKKTLKYQLQIDNLKADLEYEKKVSEERLNLKDKTIDQAHEQLRQQTKTSFWKENKFEIGIVTGIVVFGGTQLLLNKLENK